MIIWANIWWNRLFQIQFQDPFCRTTLPNYPMPDFFVHWRFINKLKCLSCKWTNKKALNSDSRAFIAFWTVSSYFSTQTKEIMDKEELWFVAILSSDFNLSKSAFCVKHWKYCCIVKQINTLVCVFLGTNPNRPCAPFSNSQNTSGKWHLKWGPQEPWWEFIFRRFDSMFGNLLRDLRFLWCSCLRACLV